MRRYLEVKWFSILAVVVLGLVMPLGLKLSEASPHTQSTGWSIPTVLTIEAQDPVVVTDSAKGLHLFFVGKAGEEDPEAPETIYYMSRIEGQWQPPLDILISSGGPAHISGAAVDAAGNLHVAWHNDDGAYHSKAHISEAGNAGRWETKLVTPGRFPSGEMLVDENDRLHMVLVIGFAEVVYLYSDDGGRSWSPPLTVFRLFETADFAVGRAQLAVDRTGGIHVTWFETAREVDWNLWSVWYGRSSDEGISWQVTEIAEASFGESDIAVDGDDNIHLVYGRNIGQADGRWHQWSDDGGATWSSARPLYPGVEYASGSTGGFDFRIDSAGRLHMVNSYSGRAGLASAWHLVWLGTRWSDPELLLGTEFHAHQPRLAISGGNELDFVAVAPDRGSSLIYRESAIDSPPLEAQAIPTRVVEMAAEAGVTDEAGAAEPTPAAPRIELSEEALQAPPTEAPFGTLLIATASAAVIILAAVLVARRSRERRL